MSAEKNAELKDRAVEYFKKCWRNMEQLSQDRTSILKQYMMKEYGTEKAGRSAVVMSDIFDTVQWILPSLMRIFLGGQDVVTLSPEGPEDVKKAELLEQKVNYDATRQNEIFRVLHDFFWDSLVMKLGVIKYWWEKTEEKMRFDYTGVSAEELSSQELNTEYEIEEIQEYPNPQNSAETLYDIRGWRLYPISRPQFAVVSPEDFIFPLDAESIEKADMIAHRVLMHESEIKRRWGVEPEELAESLASLEHDEVYRERMEDLGGTLFFQPENSKGKYFIYEVYVCDYDDKGNKTHLKLIMNGDKVLDIEENTYGKPPFIVGSPVIMPHRLVGQGVAELIQDLQEIHTVLMRIMLDNLYYQNNSMKVVNPYKINVDDLINNNYPGGIVRTIDDTNPSEAYMPIVVQPLPGNYMQMVEYNKTLKENRVGVTSYNQGLDSKSLNKTAAGISQIMSASQQRIELIARIFAEGPIKELFRILVQLNLDYFDRATMLKLNEQWMEVNPADIKAKCDVSIDVGIGTGSKEIVVQQMSNMLNEYGAVLGFAAGLPPEIAGQYLSMITPMNIHNIIKKQWEAMGYKGASQFITEPSASQMPALPPPAMGMPPNMGQEPPGLEELAGILGHRNEMGMNIPPPIEPAVAGQEGVA